MNQFLSSSLGKKVVMATTGLFLITFLIVHCAINALIFYNDGGETFLKGAEFMGTNPIIRTMEIVLFAGLAMHMYQGLMLTIQNNKARPVKYAVNNASANSKWYSRSMGLLGTLILMFLILHLKFWFYSRFTNVHNESHTLYDDMQEEFQHLWVVILYCLAMVSLAYHLIHGFYSAFQTMGWANKKYTPIIKRVGIVFSVVITFVFATMPIAIYLGLIK